VPFKICGGFRWGGNGVGGERSVCYCGQQCQRDDWRYHRLLCKKPKSFPDTEPRPSPAHKLALLLPQNEGNPVLVWMHIDTSQGFESVETDPILGPGKRGSFVVNHVPASLKLEQTSLDLATISIIAFKSLCTMNPTQLVTIPALPKS
jgi:hypothetical protein